MNIVHYGGFFVNLTITSKEEILKAGRKIAQEKGLSAINMRSVAAECNIALGTLYNYYSNKDELVLAVIESIWKDIFHIKECKDDISFLDFVVFIFSCLKDSKEKYPNFFVTHSMILESKVKDVAKDRMNNCFIHIKAMMLSVLENDKTIDSSCFSKSFSKNDFISFVFSNILLTELNAIDEQALIEVIKRII